MKGTTILFVILILAAVGFAVAAQFYRRSKDQKTASEKPLAEATQTVVVDPTTDKEILVSDFGEDNTSPDGIVAMESRTKELANQIENALGYVPRQLEYKVYNTLGTLLGTGQFDPKKSGAA